MSATELLEALGDQVGVVYVDCQPKLRIIAYDVKPKHDDCQAKYTPPKPGDVVVIKGRAVVVPALDDDGQVMPW